MATDTVRVAYKRSISVKESQTVFLLKRDVPYSGEVQQPVRATAVLGRRKHTR